MKENLSLSEMKSTFNLDDDYVNDLMTLAEERVKESVSLYEFTGVINDNLYTR
ncbi:MAG: TerB family tellurite resistance protein [Ignavibacteriales bacterium]|nr:TerB family tellurite resistance protein [Ignavibacteriales bacterium]